MENAQLNLALFTVTLPWGGSDDSGDYCVNVWAVNDEAATLAVAQEMAAHSDSGLGEDATDEEIAEFVQGTIADAGPYAAVNVSEGILGTLSTILAGPDGKMTEKSKADFEKIGTLLASYLPDSVVADFQRQQAIARDVSGNQPSAMDLDKPRI